MADNYDAAEGASLARTRAEARRRRILSSSSSRLDMVSGAVVAGTTPAPAAAAAATMMGDATPEGDAVVPPEAPKPKSAGSARLQQMRRRRAKKAQEAKEQAASAALSTDDADEVVAGTTTLEDDPAATEVAPVVPAVEPSPAVEADTTTADPVSSSTEAGTTTAPPEETSEEGDRKKYLGVARMRRKMLSERKLKKEEEQQRTTTVEAEVVDDATNVSLQRQYRVSVTLQLLTTVLLLVAGIDVGWNRVLQPVHVAPHPAVLSGESALVRLFYVPDDAYYATSTNVLDHEHDGTLLQRHYMNGAPLVDVAPVAAATITTTTVSADDSVSEVDNDDTVPEMDEEFSSSKETPATTTVPPVDDEFATTEDFTIVLDPVFGVDLDALTQGDGTLFTAARGAVEVHRLLTNTVLSFFVTYLCPPVLFLAALLLRRCARILGAGTVPAPEVVDADEGSKSGLDLVDTVIRTVKGTLLGSVPSSLTAVYGVLRDAKRDMYVVLCGVLLGVAVPLIRGHGNGGGGGGSDILRAAGGASSSTTGSNEEL